MTKQAYYNGMKTTAITGSAVVADIPDKPLYWAKTEGIIGQRIDVIEVSLDGVNYGGGIAYLDDRDCQGSQTVFEGARNVESFVSIEPSSFEPHGGSKS